MVLCISGWDDPGLGSLGVAFFWPGIGIVKARGCLFGFWFWLSIARIWAWLFHESSVPERAIGSSEVFYIQYQYEGVLILIFNQKLILKEY